MLGVDYSEGMLARASARVVSEGYENVELRRGDAVILEAVEGPFDAVISVLWYGFAKRGENMKNRIDDCCFLAAAMCSLVSALGCNGSGTPSDASTMSDTSVDVAIAPDGSMLSDSGLPMDSATDSAADGAVDASTDSGGIPADAGADAASSDASMDAALAPEVLITSPAADTVYVRDRIAIQVSVRFTEVDRVELYIDDAFFAELVPPYSFEWDVALVAEGPHTVEARAFRGSSSWISRVLNVVVDRTAPTVASVTPPAGSHMWLGDPMLVQMSEPVRPTSIAPGAFSLASVSTSEVLTTTLSVESDSSFSVRASGGLTMVPATLRARVTSALLDRAGNPALPTEWTYPIDPWVPLAGTPRDGSVSSFIWRLAVSDSAVPYVAFAVYDSSTMEGSVKVRTWDGSTWVDMPSALTAMGSSYRSVAITVAGEVPWIVARSTSGSLDVVHWDGTTWIHSGSTITDVADNADIAISSDGTPWVFWAEVTGVRLERFDGVNWNRVTSVDTSRLAAPSLAASRDGRIVGGWGDGPECAFLTWDGTMVVRPSSLSLISASCTSMDVAATSDGMAASFYTAHSGSFTSFTEVQRWNGSSWSNLSGTWSLSNAREASIAVNVDDTITVAYFRTTTTSGGGTTRGVYLRRSVSGGALTDMEELLRYWTPQLAIDASGRLTLMAEDPMGSLKIMRYNGQ
ncbi:MAG: hypothetical protein GXP55_25595 [Deltaproteobacteria bacterium]|nr:hypothetical protein [Deltaproteobacteria bacterium]